MRRHLLALMLTLTPALPALAEEPGGAGPGATPEKTEAAPSADAPKEAPEAQKVLTSYLEGVLKKKYKDAAKAAAGNANVGRSCAPGQVNDKGVGKPCQTREDCAGLWANFCDIVVNKRRPPMCSRMCDDDTDCGPGAYCGVINGVRHCYPNQCSDWKWTPGCDKWNPFCHDIRAEEPKPGDEVKHAGAMVCAGGFAYSDEGYGLRCDKTSHNLHGETCKGKRAQSCQASPHARCHQQRLHHLQHQPRHRRQRRRPLCLRYRQCRQRI